MNNHKYSTLHTFILSIGIFCSLVGCQKKTTECYSYKTLAIKISRDFKSCILLEVINKNGYRQVKTGASIYSRYSIKVLSENCFILLSSDIGDTFFLYDDGWQDFPVHIFPSPSNKYIAYVLDYKKNDVIDLLSQKNLYFLLVCNEQGNVVFYKSISIGDVTNSIVWKGNTSLEINAKTKLCIDLCDVDYYCIIEDIIKQIYKQ